MDDLNYTAKDVCSLLGVSHVTYQNWMARGLIVPSMPSPRRGIASKFSKRDLVKCKLFMTLCDLGMQHALASDIAFDEHLDDNDNHATVWINADISIQVDLSAIERTIK